MPSHDVYVLAGETGSASRTKKLNNMLDTIDKKNAQAREQNLEEYLIRSSTLAVELNWSQSTICRNGFPEFFTRHFNSITYKQNKGIVIQTEEYVEERKTQREKLEKYYSDQQESEDETE